MCGICGIIGIDLSCSSVALKSMVHALKHRGPDDNGSLFVGKDKNIGLGHTRLSILDLSQAGHQPFVDVKTKNIVVFNGEIYNFKLIRKQLQGIGYKFYSNTDTEVILKAFDKWGIDCCKKFRGIFAFAIFVADTDEVILARDHLGVKPLYYYLDPQNKLFLFASEVRALLSSGFVPRRLCHKGLHSYLAYGSVQEPFTLVDGIVSLKPGNIIKIDRYFNVSFLQYWDMQSCMKASIQNFDKEISRVRTKLSEAIDLQLLSDVPIGAFLSGGIDSSVIVSAMTNSANTIIPKTFSVIFEEKEFDERKYARIVANHFATAHNELILSGNCFNDNIEQALSDFDQPSVDGLNTWFVAKLTKEAGITVVLSGVGGDELFAGYNNFYKARKILKYFSLLNKFPASIGKLGESLAINEKMRKFFVAMSFQRHPYFLNRQFFSDFQVNNLLNTVCHGGDWFEVSYSNMLKSLNVSDEINTISFLEMNTYMLSTLLRDTDQMSMAHALEVRVPLLDVDLIEAVLAIQGEHKLSDTMPKRLLVEAIGNLPNECIIRPKQGFVLPFEKWLRLSMSNKIEAFFTDYNSSLFSRKEMCRLGRQFKDGVIDWGRVWSLYVLNDWLTRHKIILS